MDVRIVIDPNPAILNQTLCVTAVFPHEPSGPVTIAIKLGGEVVDSDEFKAPPYKLTTIPAAVGEHVACVSWPGGEEEKPFEVRAAAR